MPLRVVGHMNQRAANRRRQCLWPTPRTVSRLAVASTRTRSAASLKDASTSASNSARVSSPARSALTRRQLLRRELFPFRIAQQPVGRAGEYDANGKPPKLAPAADKRANLRIGRPSVHLLKSSRAKIERMQHSAPRPRNIGISSAQPWLNVRCRRRGSTHGEIFRFRLLRRGLFS